MKKQNGISITSLIISIAILGFIGIYGVKIGMGYIEKSELSNAVELVLSNTKITEDGSTKTVKSEILKSLSTSNFDIESDNIDVTKVGNEYIADVSLIKEINISSKIKLVVDYSFSRTSK